MLSEDSKWRILKAVQRKEKVTEIARMFGITRGSVYDIVNQYKETGNLEIRTNQRGSKPRGKSGKQASHGKAFILRKHQILFDCRIHGSWRNH